MSSESPKKSKTIWRRCVVGVLSLGFLIIAGALSVVFFAPRLLEPILLKEVRKTGLQIESIQLHKLRTQHSNFTIKGLDLGNIHVAHLPIRTTQDLRELLEHKRLRSIQVKDAKLSIKLEPDKNTNPLSINERILEVIEKLPETLPFDSVKLEKTEVTILPLAKDSPSLTKTIDVNLNKNGNLKIFCEDSKAILKIWQKQKALDINLEVKPTDTLSWLQLLDLKPENLRELKSTRIKASLEFRNAKFEKAAASIYIPELKSDEMTLENLDAQANLDAELSPSEIKANVILKDLNIDGFTAEPIPANLKWDQSGKVLVEIGTTSLKKEDVVQTKLKQGSLTLQLDPENKPVSSHWKSTHTVVHLPQAKLHLEDVQIEKYLDDQQLSVSITTDYAELDDIALGKSNIAAEISGNQLGIQGEVQFSGIKIPFKAGGNNSSFEQILQTAASFKQPKTEQLPKPEEILNALSASVGPVELKESPVLNTLPTGLPEANMSGTFSLEGNLGQQIFTLKADKAGLHFPEKNLQVSDITTVLKIKTDPAPHTLEATILKIGKITLNQLELRNGELPVTLLESGILLTPGGAFETLGGTLSLGPATLQPNGYETLATGILLLEDIDFQKVLALAETPPLELEGQFGGTLPFRYAQHELELESGILRMNPGTSGRLKYEATGKFTEKSEPGSTQFKKMQFAERAMKNLQLKEMEIQLFTEDSQGRPLPAKASIRGTYEEKNSKINLNLDLNLRGEVEKIIRNAAKGQLDLSF